MTPMSSSPLDETEKGILELGVEEQVGVFQENIYPPERSSRTLLMLCNPLTISG